MKLSLPTTRPYFDISMKRREQSHLKVLESNRSLCETHLGGSFQGSDGESMRRMHSLDVPDYCRAGFTWEKLQQTCLEGA